MTLPSFGLIKLSDIRAEYGGPNPPRLKDYYLNGGHVHQNPNGTIPSSGIITLKNFYGGVGGILSSVTVNPLYTLDLVPISASDNYHAIVFGYDGKIYSEGYAPSSGQPYRNQLGTWFPQGNAVGQYIRVTLISDPQEVVDGSIGWMEWTGGNGGYWVQVPSNNGGGYDTAGFSISFHSADDAMPDASVDLLVEFAQTPTGPATASTLVRFNLNGYVSTTPIAPGIGNFDLVSSGSNIDTIDLYFTSTVLWEDNVITTNWPAKAYGRLTILSTTTFYPSTGFWYSDFDGLVFTGGPQGHHQQNPPLPFTSAWINLAAGGLINVRAEIASGNEFPPATPSSWVKFRIEFASAPGNEYITHSQDFTIDIYN